MENDAELISKVIDELVLSTQIQDMDKFPHHGSTSCLLHCIGVTYTCARISHLFHLSDKRKRHMIRAALMHDYFLYDWHDSNSHELLHAGNHASVALRNAQKVLDLTEIEKNMIESHMFPISFTKYPKYRESVILVMSDKICALYETLHRSACYRGGEIEKIINNSDISISNWKTQNNQGR